MRCFILRRYFFTDMLQYCENTKNFDGKIATLVEALI